MLANGKEVCNCVKKKCERFGNCEACIEFHKKSEKRPLPYCKRVKETEDNTNSIQ